MQTPIRSIAMMKAETPHAVALLVQSIKVAVFFLTIGIPSVMHDGISFRAAASSLSCTRSSARIRTHAAIVTADRSGATRRCTR